MNRTPLNLLLVALFAFLVLAPGSAFSQDEDAAGIYIIFDASGSMWGQLSDRTHKIEAAREVLKEFVKSDFDGKVLALRAYGHNRKGDCSDTELIVPFTDPAGAAKKMAAFADHVNPKGKTPISRSLRAALEDFGDRSGEIILISDGIETCDEDPCELMRLWMEKDVKIKVHVVGLGLNEEEKAAMECISEAAGTEYQNAGSAAELTEGLTRIHEKTRRVALIIKGTTDEGERMKVEGVAVPAGEEGAGLIEVKSHYRNQVAAGEYEVTVGVRTRNGDLYKTVTKSIRVADSGETVLDVVVEEPPSVKAKFLERGEEKRGAIVTAFENDREAFSFRWMDRVYLNPGTYEFRCSPNDENDLSVSESFGDGDHKEIIFEMIHTVHAVIKLVAEGSGIDFRENYELWQDGERKRKVHWRNGVHALPGTYDLHLVNPLTPYVVTGFVLTEKDKQDYRIEVPAGHVTVIYQKADGSRDKDDRCWITRNSGEKWVGSKTQRAGEPIPLIPGSYRVKGWSHKGTYGLIDFEVRSGDEKEIVLRDLGGNN